MTRKSPRDYTTISIKRVSRNLADEVLKAHKDEWERIGIRSFSDLYEEALIALKMLLDADRIDFPPSTAPKIRIRGL